MLVLLMWFGLVPKGQPMKIHPFKLVVGTIIGVLFFLIVLPFILIKELIWMSTPHVKTSKRIRALTVEFDADARKICEGASVVSDKAFDTVIALAKRDYYKELVERRTLYLGIMTAASYLLPKDKFKKNEFALLYYAKMGTGFITGRPKELTVAKMFSNSKTVGDVAAAMIFSGSLVEEDFRKHFAETNTTHLQQFLNRSVIEILSLPSIEKYQEPGPCG